MIDKKKTENPQVPKFESFDHSKQNLIEDYNENILVSETAKQQEQSILSEGQTSTSELGKMTNLTTSFQDFRKEHKMVVLDMYPATTRNNNGAFTEKILFKKS